MLIKSLSKTIFLLVFTFSALGSLQAQLKDKVKKNNQGDKECLREGEAPILYILITPRYDRSGELMEFPCDPVVEIINKATGVKILQPISMSNFHPTVPANDILPEFTGLYLTEISLPVVINSDCFRNTLQYTATLQCFDENGRLFDIDFCSDPSWKPFFSQIPEDDCMHVMNLNYALCCQGKDLNDGDHQSRLLANEAVDYSFASQSLTSSTLRLATRYKEDISVLLSDINGRFYSVTQQRQDNKTINLEHEPLPSGIYITTIIIDGQPISKKFIIMR